MEMTEIIARRLSERRVEVVLYEGTQAEIRADGLTFSDALRALANECERTPLGIAYEGDPDLKFPYHYPAAC